MGRCHEMPALACATSLLAALCCMPAWAADAGAKPANGSTWVAIKPARLDAMRGGYRLPSGVVLSFGFERVAFVNGQVVSHLEISIADIANLTAEQAGQLADIGQTELVQVGPGNTFLGTGTAGLVIQNTLDGQKINAQTTLNASVGTLALYQSLNVDQALRDASLLAPGGL